MNSCSEWQIMMVSGGERILILPCSSKSLGAFSRRAFVRVMQYLRKSPGAADRVASGWSGIVTLSMKMFKYLISVLYYIL